jgi:hypothetical protein
MSNIRGAMLGLTPSPCAQVQTAEGWGHWRNDLNEIQLIINRLGIINYLSVNNPTGYLMGSMFFNKSISL